MTSVPTPTPQRAPISVWLILLIVLAGACLGSIAVLAIVAAIVAPNFLEANIRSKVSRSRADMRSLAVALESYYVDYNVYPAKYSQVTTPVAYMTMIPADPFAPTPGDPHKFASKGEGWIIWGCGPDQVFQITPEDYDDASTSPTDRLYQLSYDPTNGMVSYGDIWRIRQ